jgi:L-ascorbate metabolism protein UlaG (beta-lactamase superfamily)
MKIKWLGHSSFLLTSDKGTRIITDPYTPGQGLSYAPIGEAADAVTISHEHSDHNNEQAIKGNPKIIRGEGEAKVGGVAIKGVGSFHDGEKGSQRGKNTVFCFDIDGMNLCHLGDLGQMLNEKQIGEIGRVDILLIPIGGYFTIDAQQATAVVAALKPRLIFPMHFKTAKSNFPIAGVEPFLKDKARVQKSTQSETTVSQYDLPAEAEIRLLAFSQ